MKNSYFILVLGSTILKSRMTVAESRMYLGTGGVGGGGVFSSFLLI